MEEFFAAAIDFAERRWLKKPSIDKPHGVVTYDFDHDKIYDVELELYMKFAQEHHAKLWLESGLNGGFKIRMIFNPLK